MGFLTAHGKWETQSDPEFTVSMRQDGCKAQKCSQNKGGAGFSLERTSCGTANNIPENSNAVSAGPCLRTASEID